MVFRFGTGKTQKYSVYINIYGRNSKKLSHSKYLNTDWLTFSIASINMVSDKQTYRKSLKKKKKS